MNARSSEQPLASAHTPNKILQSDLEKLERLADWMDSKFILPGTSIRFGFDSLIGLIPGLGDTATLAVSAFLIGKARSYNLPWHVSALMIWNAFIDWLIGLIPFLGDIFDIGWKANRKNVALLRKHLDSRTSHHHAD